MASPITNNNITLNTSVSAPAASKPKGPKTVSPEFLEKMNGVVGKKDSLNRSLTSSVSGEVVEHKKGTGLNDKVIGQLQQKLGIEQKKEQNQDNQVDKAAAQQLASKTEHKIARTEAMARELLANLQNTSLVKDDLEGFILMEMSEGDAPVIEQPSWFSRLSKVALELLKKTEAPKQ